MDAAATSVYELAASTQNMQQASPQGASVTNFDVANFQDALAKFDPSQMDATQVGSSDNANAPAQGAESAMLPGLKNAGEAALNLSDHAGQVRSEAFEALANKDELSPGDMLNLTVEVHKFSFHAQLSSNVANRSSQGVQELFRQQL